MGVCVCFADRFIMACLFVCCSAGCDALLCEKIVGYVEESYAEHVALLPAPQLLTQFNTFIMPPTCTCRRPMPKWPFDNLTAALASARGVGRGGVAGRSVHSVP